MIEEIELVNFQPHKKTRIKLDRITSLIGDNRKGKTAIVRALRWTLLNQVPKSQEGHLNIIRWGRKTARVTVTFDGGRKLTRRRTNRENTYRLDGEILRAVSRGGIPKLVLDAIGMTEDNFQQQFQSLFWFAESPAQISKRLNKMVDQEIVDGVAEELRKLNRKYHAHKELVEESINEAKTTIKETKFAADALGQIESMSILNESLESIRVKKDLLQQAIRLKNESESCERQYAKFAHAFESLLSLGQDAKRASDETSTLRDLRDSLQKEMERKVLYDACDAIEHQCIRVTTLQSRVEEVHQSWSKLNEYRQQIRKLERSVRKSQHSCTVREKRYQKLFRGKRCPVCGKPVNLAKLNI